MFDLYKVICYNVYGDIMDVLTKRQQDTLNIVKKFMPFNGTEENI